MKQPANRKSIDYKWIIVGLCFLMIFCCLGFCSSTKMVFTPAIIEAFESTGMTRSAFALNDSFRFVATAVINLFFGLLIARFGTKKLICAGFFSLIAAVLVYAVATNVYMFYLGGTLLGIGFSWTGTTMVGSVVNKWCPEKRGTVMGFILAANGLGGALAQNVVDSIIRSRAHDPFGYRTAYFVIAIILAAATCIFLIFFRDQPKDHDDLVPVKSATPSKKRKRGQAWVGIPFHDVVRMPIFYAAIVCIFFTGFVLSGINNVASTHMKVQVFSTDTTGFVAWVLSAHSIALAGFKFLSGLLYDKRGLRFTMVMCSVAAILSMLSLAPMTDSPLGKALAFFWGIISSLALPLETVMVPIYAADLFGDHSFNQVLGLFVSVNTAGMALGGPVMHGIFDITGSYVPAFILGACVMLACLIGMLFVLNVAQQHREKILAAEEA